MEDLCITQSLCNWTKHTLTSGMTFLMASLALFSSKDGRLLITLTFWASIPELENNIHIFIKLSNNHLQLFLMFACSTSIGQQVASQCWMFWNCFKLHTNEQKVIFHKNMGLGHWKILFQNFIYCKWYLGQFCKLHTVSQNCFKLHTNSWIGILRCKKIWFEPLKAHFTYFSEWHWWYRYFL